VSLDVNDKNVYEGFTDTIKKRQNASLNIVSLSVLVCMTARNAEYSK